MRRLSFLPLLLLVLSCATTPPPRQAGGIAGFDRAAAVVEEALAAGKFPGGVLWVERGGAAESRAFGARSLVPAREHNAADTIYDLASLTKVMATAPSIAILAERGLVEIDAPVSRYLPEYRGGLRDAVTVRHLLTHTSGMPPSLSLAEPWSGYEEGIRRAVATEPVYRPGPVFVYSDINFILLGEIVRAVSGQRLDRFAAENIYEPLGLRDTGFLPPASVRIAPTQQVEEGMLRGVVHDPTSRRMGGIAGHAGLFSTAADVARYARMLLAGGQLDGVRIMKEETVRRMTSLGSPPEAFARRTLGWDLDTGFSRPRGGFPLGSFGHTGWTGNIIWIDPSSSSFYVFLSNRNHPDGSGSIINLQRDLGATVSEILIGRRELAEGVRVHPSRTGGVTPGLDSLAAKRFAPLRGKRVGLITNHTGRDRYGTPAIDLFRAAAGVNLVRVFSPEHGITGTLDESVGDAFDETRGMQIVSLYGTRRAPEPGHLEDLDILVFDIQDIGARYYTYISTLGLAMEAAARAGVEVMVLDRPNPVGGERVEGPVAEGGSTFTSYHPIAMRHGMTVGELAKMFREEKGLSSLELTVVPMEGWSRAKLWDDDGLPWIDPSPNIRSSRAAMLYLMLGFLETTNLSVGRGTDAPFEQFGAPWIDGESLAMELGERIPAGCLRFRPVSFTPASSVYAGERVSGVSIQIVDARACSMVEAGLVLADLLATSYPDWNTEKLPVLLRHEATVEAIRAGRAAASALELWQPELREFEERRARHLLYR